VTANAAAAPAAVKLAGRSPLAQLLHALNQPLTGLQCSMEVALASLRTPEQYVRGLREGLELTERMRALVGAIREVTDMEEENRFAADREEGTAAEWSAMVRATLDDLEPVAEMKSVRVEFECDGATACASAAMAARRIETAVFHLLESALGAAALGSALRVQVGSDGAGQKNAAWMLARWQAGWPASKVWRAEIGLLVAQAGFERAGATWARERTGEMETVTVRRSGGGIERPQSFSS
jgi:hypothetical protein